MRPIGVWLHEPSMTCCPFVFCEPGNSRQKLMKLFVEVIEGSWPAVALALPSDANAVKTLDGSRVSDV